MKKILSVLLAVLMLTALLCACGETNEPVKSSGDEKTVPSEAADPTPSEGTDEPVKSEAEEPVPSEAEEPVPSEAEESSDPEPTDPEPTEHVHAYGKWIGEAAATCTKAGTKGHYHCDGCGKDFDDKYNELSSLTVAAKGHKEETVKGYAATCVKTGLTDGKKCSVCGQMLTKQTEIAKTDHTYGAWNAEVAATSTADGIAAHYHCAVCGKNFDASHKELATVVIPATGEPEEPQPVVILPTEGKTKWKAVYSEDDHFRVTGAANSLQRTIKKVYNYYVTLEKDTWNAPNAEALEILVGATNRPESAEALKDLADNEYIIKLDGNKLILNAKDPYGVRYAMRVFLAEYVTEKSGLSLMPGYAKKGTYEIPETIKLLDSMKRGFNVFSDGYRPSGQQEYMYTTLKEGGFDHVRLPLNLSKCFDASGNPIEEQVTYVDNAVKWALENGFVALLDFHAWKNLCTASPKQSDIDLFVKIWEFFAERYKDLPAGLCFEIFNEPHDISTVDWDKIQTRVYNAIRAIDEDRIIFLSPANWNEPSSFASLTVPYDDDAVAVDEHDYIPHTFTHQGYDGRPTGVPYTEDVYDQFIKQIDKAVSNRKTSGIQHVLGEFGVIRNAEDDDEVAFLCDVTTYMEKYDLAWTMWEFSGFKELYNKDEGTWHPLHMKAIMTDDYLRYNQAK